MCLVGSTGYVWFVVTWYSAKLGLVARVGFDDAGHVRVKAANLVGYASELSVLVPHSKRGRPVRVYQNLEELTYMRVVRVACQID